MQEITSKIPPDNSDYPEKAVLIRAEQGILELVELMTAAERLSASGKKDKAAELYRVWLDHTSSPLAYVAYFNLGTTLSSIQDFHRAEVMYRKALALNPRLIQARLNLGTCLEQQKRDDEALDQWQDALATDGITLPENKLLRLHALNNLGRLLEIKRQYLTALEMLEKSFAIDPTQRDVLIHLVHLTQKVCRWPVYNPPKGTKKLDMIKYTSPLAMLAISDDPDLQLSVAKRFVEYKFPAINSERLAPQEGYGHKKIRIGYLSSDLSMHAVSLLTVELFERHDREKFEVYGFCWSREDGSAFRQRVVAGMDHFIRIGQMDDRQAAETIRAHEIDIIVDLQGLTSGARPLILSYRPAPMQITYLGFPGPTGLPWIDYVVADRYLIPEDTVQYFTEKPLYMPGCFQVSDSKREVAQRPSRAEYFLPEDAFVFCSFNNNYKYTPEMFAAWMRILKKVPKSVLWLLADNEWAKENLIKAAKKHGIKKDRLIFAPRVVPAAYLARYQLADLFLDTFPFNGGTTANDALFMGLPLLTLSGRSLASRYAGSLLANLGLPELIASSLDKYEERAVRLAKKEEELSSLKKRLNQNKKAGPVFNTYLFVQSYEDELSRVLREQEERSTCHSKENNRAVVSRNKTGYSLLVQGWTGINHSYALVNQYQLLALATNPSINLFQQEMPYVSQTWNKDKNSAGFSDVERSVLAGVKQYNGESVSSIFRIHSPNSLENADAQVISFMVTELGLTQNNFTQSANVRSYVENGNLVVTPSHWSRDRIIDFGFSEDSVFVVPHGVDRGKFFLIDEEVRKKSREGLGYKDDEVLFLNVGAPIWNKGMDLLIQAFFTTRKKHTNIRLLIKDQQSLYGLSAQNMVRDLLAAGKIEIDNESISSIRILPSTLSIDQLRMLYNVADYYVSPYRAEGFNLPVIEAIACGTRAIVTSGGSTDDFCDDMTSLKIPSTKNEHIVVQNINVSAYLDPDFDSLVSIMEKCACQKMIDPVRFAFGRCDMLQKFTWERAAKLISALV